MKKKILGLIGVGALSVGVLAGCVSQPEPLYFEDKLMPEENAEEILENRLEDENGIDYEVNISVEVEE